MNHFTKNILVFGGVFLIALFASFGLLYLLGFVPTQFEEQTRDNTVASQITDGAFQGLGLISSSSLSSSNVAPKGELPVRIVASSIGLDSLVEIPSSTNFTVLDNELAKGPVYYPGSGQAGTGNMFIFGHSTGFKVVINKAYQVFNHLKDLKEGDEIKVYSAQKVYVYKVQSIKLVDGKETLVDFSHNSNILTLSTCDSFGKQTDRYVATAIYTP